MAYRSGGGRGGRRPPYGHWRGGDRGARQTGFVRLHRPVPAQYLVPMGYRARMVVPHQDAHPQVTFSPAPPALPPLIFVGPSSPAPRHLAAEPAPPSSAPSAAALAEEAGKNPLVPERALAPPAAAAAAASAEKTLLMSETAAAAASVVAAQGAADSEGEDAWGGDPAPISRCLALARPNRLGKEAMRSADRFLVDVADNNLFHNVAINPESELIAYEPFVWKDFDVTTIDKHKTKRFPTEEKGTRKTAVQYFWDKYNYNLKYAFGPCLQADSDLYPVYLPMEMGLIDIHKFETAIGSDCVAPVPSLCYHDSSWEEVHIPICGLLMLSKVIGQNRILGYVHALSDVSRVSSCPTLATVRGPEAILEDTTVDLPELTACSVFICVGRCKICMFPKLKTTTVIQLVEDALNKTKTKFWDSSLSFNGKPLHGDEILSEIPVFNNSSIHVIPRIRGGMPYIQHGFEQVWYEQLDIVLATNANTRFQHVVLPPELRARGGHEFVYFLGPFTQYLLHRIFIFVFRDGHQRGRCWGGGFGIENILYSTNGDVIIDPMVPWYGYSPQGAAADRLQLHNIIDAHLRLPNGKYAVHVEYLLNLLRMDDEDIWGNLDVITFVINHPSLLSFSDMRKWFDLIDQLIRQLHPNDLFRLRQIFGNPLFDGWNEEVKSVPGFTHTYMRNARLDQTGQANVSVYTRHMDQGFHFARNFLNHPPPGVSQMVSIAAIVNVMELMLAVFVLLLICQFMQPAHGNWNLKEIIANPNSDKSALPP